MSTSVTMVGAGLGGLVLEGRQHYRLLDTAGTVVVDSPDDGAWPRIRPLVSDALIGYEAALFPRSAATAEAAAAVGELTPEQVVEFPATSGGQK